MNQKEKIIKVLENKKVPDSYIQKPYERKYHSQIVDLFIQTYQRGNPIYMSIKMTDNEILDLIKDSFENEATFKDSLLFIEKETDQILGACFNEDLATFAVKKELRTFHKNPKLALKQQIEYNLIDQFFLDAKTNKLKIQKIDENEDLVPGNIKSGQVMFMIRGCVNYKVQKSGLGTTFMSDCMKFILNQGYPYAYGIVHNGMVGEICKRFTGVVSRRTDLKNMQDSEGNYVFKDNQYGMANIVYDLQNENNVDFIQYCKVRKIKAYKEMKSQTQPKL